MRYSLYSNYILKQVHLEKADIFPYLVQFIIHHNDNLFHPIPSKVFGFRYIDVKTTKQPLINPYTVKLSIRFCFIHQMSLYVPER